MKKYIQEMQKELNESRLMPVFEIEVIDNKTGEQGYLLCDIFFRGNKLVAQRTALNKREQESKKIAETSILCDDCFSLDEHLQELYSAIIEELMQNEEFYSLPTE